MVAMAKSRLDIPSDRMTRLFGKIERRGGKRVYGPHIMTSKVGRLAAANLARAVKMREKLARDPFAKLVPMGTPPPPAVAGASWQAGITYEHECWRPFCDGEPVAGAIAASCGNYGWVMANDRRATGRVTLVPVPRVCR